MKVTRPLPRSKLSLFAVTILVIVEIKMATVMLFYNAYLC